MDTVEPLRLILSFGLVLALIGLFAVALRWFAARNPKWLVPSAGRLQVVESKMIDARRKMVLVKRDSQEHLLLLSPNGELLIETVKDTTGA